MTYEEAKDIAALRVFNKRFDQVVLRRPLEDVIVICNDAAELYAQEALREYDRTKRSGLIDDKINKALKDCYTDE